MNATRLTNSMGLGRLFSVRSGLALFAPFITLFTACDPLGFASPRNAVPEIYFPLAFPDTTYAGSRYTRVLSLEDFKAPYTLTIHLSDSLMDSMFAEYPGPGLDVGWVARDHADTLRIRIEGDGWFAFREVSIVSKAATGFAPLESSRVWTYREMIGGGCASTGYPPRWFDVTLTPLGSASGGYRWEFKKQDSTGALSSLDTLLLRRMGNVVERWTDTGWTVPGAEVFPYFVHDTLTTLNDEAESGSVIGTLKGFIDGASVTARYRPDSGLIDYDESSGWTVCGASYVRRILPK